jgi:hypothetical protein
VTWRQGTRATNGNPDAAMTSWFLAIRARPANRDIPRGPDGALPDCWLLAEWPPKADEPTGYWLSPLPADTAIEELVRLAKIRRPVEHDYREPKWISSGQSPTIQNDLTSYSSGTHEERRPPVPSSHQREARLLTYKRLYGKLKPFGAKSELTTCDIRPERR